MSKEEIKIHATIVGATATFTFQLNKICCTSQVQCDQKKVAKCLYKLPKMISLEKLKILTPLQKSPKNVRDLGKLIVATGFEKWPKVQ